MLTVLEQGFITLVRSCLKNKKIALPEGFDTSKLYEAAKMHHMMNIIYTGAVLCGIDKELPEMKKLFVGALREASIEEIQHKEIERVKKLFSKEDIDFMPLKGALLKGLYPLPYMRYMSDIDILIRMEQYEKISSILKEAGYEFRLESDHEYVWKKKNVLNIELHKMLIPSYNKDFYRYFGDGWNKAVKGECGFSMSKEDEFIYIFTHFAKHYRSRGAGVKYLTDIYLFLNSYELDCKYIEEELSKLKLLEFYKNILETIDCWFEGKCLTEKAELISSFIIRSGAYGTHDNGMASSLLRQKANNPKNKKGIKTRLIISRTFPSLSVMRIHNKYLDKTPFLLPVAWIKRLVVALIKKRKNIARHIDDIKRISSKNIWDFESQLKFVGLDFDFRE